ncbi:hypothetical protein [Oryzicola mucosus]|uniref:Uncharacterized protein n=1 Tax=Oryzicola mucosus TaxID=2767425 RepID=A0A8J6PSW8_9HYPH|nr:hypothetical protein [Oryzicola mucosus]MBD0413521.1 hypothetical protein [Oryzicola mucosus]
MANGKKQSARYEMDREWELIHPEPYSRSRALGTSLLRLTLLFGIGAVAFVLFASAFADSRARPQMARNGLDLTTTGSVKRDYQTPSLR